MNSKSGLWKLKKMKTYRIKKTPLKGICRIWRCKRQAQVRGLCRNHYGYLARTGRLELCAGKLVGHSLSPEDAVTRIERMRKSKRPKEGICNIIESNRACKEQTRKGGMCDRHYLALWRRGLLKKFKHR